MIFFLELLVACFCLSWSLHQEYVIAEALLKVLEPPEVHFTISSLVQYNKQFTN